MNYLCDFARDYCVNGRKFYNDLHLEDILNFAEFYLSVEEMVFDKTGKTSVDLNFYLSLPDAISICKRYLPERNAKRVLLNLQRYRRRQLKEFESGYYTFRDRVKELESELAEQKKLNEAAKSDAEKAALADAFLQGDNCMTAQEFNVILRQNGIAKTYPTTIFRVMERLKWIDNSGTVKHIPTSFGIDGGFVRLEQEVKNSRTWQYSAVVITPKGQAALLEYFKRTSSSNKAEKDGETR